MFDLLYSTLQRLIVIVNALSSLFKKQCERNFLFKLFNEARVDAEVGFFSLQSTLLNLFKYCKESIKTD